MLDIGMKKNIWIINQYASHLETRHLELSKVFAENGCKVTVITSSYHHGKREYIYPEEMRCVERAENVNYIYLKVKPEYKSNGLKRVLSWFGFCTLFLRKLGKIEKIAGKPDFVIASSAPPTVWELGLHCAKKYGAKFIAEFRDIWPLSLVEVQGLSPRHPAVIFFGILEKRAYRKSDAIVATMPYAAEHVVKVSGVSEDKIHWMPNGINTGDYDRMLREAPDLPEDLNKFLEEHWCAVYSGSLAKCEHVDFLIDSFREINNPNICLAVIGEGGEGETLRQMVVDYGQKNVRIFDAVTREQVPKVLRKSGSCVAAIEDLPIYEYGLSINKLSEYLYSGKPVVFACDADNVVREAGHFALPYGNPQRMAETIESVYRLPADSLAELADKGRRLIREEYDYRVIGQRYLNMLEAR